MKLSPLGLTAVGAGVPDVGFIAPVTRSLADGSSTGVAIASAGQPVKVHLTLRTEKGEAVSGGTARVPRHNYLDRLRKRHCGNRSRAQRQGGTTHDPPGFAAALTKTCLSTGSGYFNHGDTESTENSLRNY
jgi:hypothetical protein